MCGIFFSARRISLPEDAAADGPGYSDNYTEVCQALRQANAARGPDAQKTHRLYLGDGACDNALDENNVDELSNSTDTSVHTGLAVDFYASELCLRGDLPVVQPHMKDGNVLCWNGEIFDGMDISSHENDGAKLFDALCLLETAEQTRDLFGSIEGPYAFIFYHVASRRLYFARDPLGRRSLLIHKPTVERPYLLLSSVSAGINTGYCFEELCTDFIYCLDLGALTSHNEIQLGYSCSLTSLPRTSPFKDTENIPYAEPQKVNQELPPDDLPRLQSLDSIPDYLTQVVEDFFYQLDRSVMLRVRDIPPPSNGGARLAVLFSGGIDSTILTFLAHSHIPLEEPIDLLNVGFENPRKNRIPKEGNVGALPKREKKRLSRSQDTPLQSTHTSYNVPDRITGLQEVEELRRICPGRLWNFVEINVPYQESQAARQTVESLMLPGRTVMDLSLALALYFASRGIGQVRNSRDEEAKPYSSTARVLLNGLGSDELLGGYGRHRTAFQTGGWKAVIDELQLDLDRIPTRNLGRDDRTISSHGKETRHPFLSLSIVAFLASLPVHYKMDPRLDVGVGDKTLLRLLARKVGLLEASTRKKRAMQFGSHSARMEGERRGDIEIVQ